jgi:Domain of unknown function (DUF4352)
MEPMTTTRGVTDVRGVTTRRLGPLLLAGFLVLGATACNAFSDPEAQESSVDAERENREEGDVEGALGDELEVYGLTAVVTSVERVETFSEIDNRGYIVADVSMTNTTGESVDYNRADWQIEKPDGTLSNTANVADQPQLQDDTIPDGATIEGKVIYTVGDADGQFAIIFQPATLMSDDPLEAERAVWVFESAPGDAS